MGVFAPCYGPKSAVHEHFQRWASAGIFAEMFRLGAELHGPEWTWQSMGSSLVQSSLVVERSFAWLIGFWAIRTQCTCRGKNHLALLHLACALVLSRRIEAIAWSTFKYAGFPRKGWSTTFPPRSMRSATLLNRMTPRARSRRDHLGGVGDGSRLILAAGHDRAAPRVPSATSPITWSAIRTSCSTANPERRWAAGGRRFQALLCSSRCRARNSSVSR